MEHKKWEKDSTPYLVFTCSKCKQYSYVKTTQKTKKCLRCGRTHQVKNVLDKGEIVNGMTKAVNKVKERQNSLGEAQFSSEKEFVLQSLVKMVNKKSEEIKDSNLLFQKSLEKMVAKYKKVPYYIIEILAQEYGIPVSEIKLLALKYIGRDKIYFSLEKR